jgi:hypothetical protein
VAVCVLVQAPPAKELEWDEDTLVGQVRWVRRLEALVAALEGPTPDGQGAPLGAQPGPDDVRVVSAVHASIAEVTKCMDETCSFNGECWLPSLPHPLPPTLPPLLPSLVVPLWCACTPVALFYVRPV